MFAFSLQQLIPTMYTVWISTTLNQCMLTMGVIFDEFNSL